MPTSTDWRNINFSNDLVKQARNFIEFLSHINSKNSFLNDGDLLQKALYRYEKFWLPFYVNNLDQQYYPPIDVAWAWICHMIHPNEYINDCEVLTGRIIPYSSENVHDIESKQKETVETWEKNTGLTFDHLNENSVAGNFAEFKSNLTFDFIATSSQLASFYYQISLPHFRSNEYLQLCLDRYKKFLFVKKQFPHDLLVPCNGIHLFWYAHRLSCDKYVSETKEFIIDDFSSSNSLNDSSDDYLRKSKNADRTRLLWKELFGEEYFFPGAMSRGNRPIEPYFIKNTNVEYSIFFSRHGKINLMEAKIICDKEVKHSEKAKYHLEVTKNNSQNKIYFGDLSLNEVLKFDHSVEFDQSDQSSLHFIVCARFRETFADKLVNTFKYLPKHDESCDVCFEPELTIPQKGTEYQFFAYKLKDPRGNIFTLDQKWRVETVIDKSILFELYTEPFQAVNMKYVAHEYQGYFDFADRCFDGEENSEAIRAEHQVTTVINNDLVDLFKIEIFHVASLQWSSVRIFVDDKVVATSHLIGSNHLPLTSQIIKPDESNIVCFDPKSESAMLVRNLNGDYAIVKATWVGRERRLQHKFRTLRNASSDLDHLRLSIYLVDQKTTQTIDIRPDLPIKFQTATTKMSIDLKTGKIEVKLMNDVVNDLEVESNIAIAFAIAILHVSLQPKPAPYLETTLASNSKPKCNPYYTTPISQTSKETSSSKKLKWIDISSYDLLKCIGFADLICLDSFYHRYCSFIHHQQQKHNQNHRHHHFLNNHHHHHHYHSNHHTADNSDNQISESYWFIEAGHMGPRDTDNSSSEEDKSRDSDAASTWENSGSFDLPSGSSHSLSGTNHVNGNLVTTNGSGEIGH